jgi:hypothetical protein
MIRMLLGMRHKIANIFARREMDPRITRPLLKKTLRFFRETYMNTFPHQKTLLGHFCIIPPNGRIAGHIPVIEGGREDE